MSPGTHPFQVNIVRDAAPSPSQFARAVTLLQAEYSISLKDIANARVYALHGFAHHLHLTDVRPLQAGDQPQGGGFIA